MAHKAPKITERSISDYMPDDHNANLGSERGLQMLENSLTEDGVGRSIVADKNGKVPAGNKTLEAASSVGITKVLEVETDGDTLIVHKRRDWDLDDPTGAARRYAYRDNRTSEVSLTWDANVIAADVAAGVLPEHIFMEYELNAILDRNQEEIDRAAMWQGMPEFEQEHQLGIKQIIVHFKSEDDLKAFAELVQQPMTMHTKYIWYPQAEKVDGKSRKVLDES